MAKRNLKLYPQQKAEIKRFYLQKTDAQLAASIGSDVKTVKAFMRAEKLVRSEYTLKKLMGNIDVIEPVTVDASEN